MSAIPQHPHHDASHPRRWIILTVVLVASFMVLLDISIVNVAIPSIQRSLKASYGQVQLVIAFYALAYAVVLITGGRLGDIFGRRRLFIIGMTGFTIASALCGMAASLWQIILFRVLRGRKGCPHRGRINWFAAPIPKSNSQLSLQFLTFKNSRRTCSRVIPAAEGSDV